MDREARNFYQGTNSDLYFRHMETITLNFAKLVQVAKILNLFLYYCLVFIYIPFNE